MGGSGQVHVCWTIDCEATQKAISDIEMGVRSIRGFVELLAEAGLKGTLFVLPSDAVAYPALLRELASQGLEIGLHYHPQEEGHRDFCGAYSEIEQMVMYSEATTMLSQSTVKPTPVKLALVSLVSNASRTRGPSTVGDAA